MGKQQGSTKEFDKNWVARSEATRSHWSKGKPKHQIELAFQQHFDFIKEVIGLPKEGAVLDVGAGRGSMSSIFADEGYDVTLLDSSSHVLDVAKNIFSANKHDASYICSDVQSMPVEDASFDVVISIGLLEHFKDIVPPMREQLRILKPGGTFIAYIIPQRKDNVQTLFQPLNDALKKFAFLFGQSNKVKQKSRVYRNDYDSKQYVRYLKRKRDVVGIRTTGIYPFPELSYSPSFPFTVLPQFIESTIVRVYINILEWRRRVYNKHPWMCEEELGQGFMVWCKKKK